MIAAHLGCVVTPMLRPTLLGARYFTKSVKTLLYAVFHRCLQVDDCIFRIAKLLVEMILKLP